MLTISDVTSVLGKVPQLENPLLIRVDKEYLRDQMRQREKELIDDLNWRMWEFENTEDIHVGDLCSQNITYAVYFNISSVLPDRETDNATATNRTNGKNLTDDDFNFVYHFDKDNFGITTNKLRANGTFVIADVDTLIGDEPMEFENDF